LTLAKTMATNKYVPSSPCTSMPDTSAVVTHTAVASTIHLISNDRIMSSQRTG
jgi:hypothetical protein